MVDASRQHKRRKESERENNATDRMQQIVLDTGGLLRGSSKSKPLTIETTGENHEHEYEHRYR